MTDGKNIFYPQNTEKSKWLSFYSNVFDFVEIDSTYYNIPNPFGVKSWYNKKPPNFKFSVKFLKVITHEKKFKYLENELERFLKINFAFEEQINNITYSTSSIP